MFSKSITTLDISNGALTFSPFNTDLFGNYLFQISVNLDAKMLDIFEEELLKFPNLTYLNIANHQIEYKLFSYSGDHSQIIKLANKLIVLKISEKYRNYEHIFPLYPHVIIQFSK